MVNMKITTKHLNLYIIFYFVKIKRVSKRPQNGPQKGLIEAFLSGPHYYRIWKTFALKGCVICELWLWKLGLLNTSSEECLFFKICFECVGTRSYIVCSLCVWISLSPQTGVDAGGDTNFGWQRMISLNVQPWYCWTKFLLLPTYGR